MKYVSLLFLLLLFLTHLSLLYQHLLESLRTSPSTPIPELLNKTFHLVDTKLSQLAKSENTHSGCTAVTAFLRLEDEHGNAVGEVGGVGSSVVEVKEGELKGKADGALRAAASSDDGENGGSLGGAALMRTKSRKALEEERAQEVEENELKGENESSDSVGEKIKNLVLGGNSRSEEEESIRSNGLEVLTPTAEVKGPAEVKKAAKRTLYTANVGDARAVLSCVSFLYFSLFNDS